MINIKNKEQIELMRAAGKLVFKAHELVKAHIKVGISTKELDTIVYEFLKANGAVSSFKGYRGYEANICVSINEEVIHGIPGLRKLKNGDIVSVDIGAFLNGYHGDAARTYGVGFISEEDKKLIDVTKQSFFEGIKFAKNGNHLHEISGAIYDYAINNGFSVVRDFVGHGIGAKMHEEPEIPHFKMPNRGPKLTPGMALAIEPMINAGVAGVTILKDGWTVVTKDKKKSAHYENTIIITEDEPEILTLY